MTTSRVGTTKVHHMNQVPNPTKSNNMVCTESDSHVDTACAGKNVTLLSYTGYKCNVNGFHSDLKSTEKIPVATAVTSYDDPLLVNTVMLIFNQALWFGSSMVKPLTATNQVLSHVIKILDDTYEQNRPLGIFDHDSDWYIHFNVQQYFSGVETRAPTI